MTSAVDSLITEARRQAAEIHGAARRPVAVSILLNRLADALESFPVAAPTREEIIGAAKAGYLGGAPGTDPFGSIADAVLALPGLSERTTK